MNERRELAARIKEELSEAPANEAKRQAALAIEIFCRRARHYLAAYIAELGGVDAIAFGGGIGENCPDIRRRIIGDLTWAGIALSPEANSACVGVAANIAAPTSRAAIIVVPVDEASVIAGEAAELMRPRV